MVGFLERVPDLSGSWEFALSIGTDGCGIELFPLTGAGVLRISQADTTLIFTVLSPCGTILAAGEGTVGHDGIAIVSWEESFVAGETCRLTLKTVAAGSATADAQTVTGSFTLTVGPANDHQSCSATFPCDIKGSFAAERCPSAGCEFASCGD